VQLTTLLLVDYFKGIKPTNPHHRLSQDQLEKWAIECDIDSSEPPQYIRDFFNAFGTLAWDHPANRAQHSFMEILRMRRNLSDNPSQKAMRLFYRIFETVDAEIDAKTDTLTIRGEAVEWRIRPITGYGGDFYRVQGWNARDYRWESVCIHSLVQHLPTGDHLSTLLRAFSNDTKMAHLVETIQPLVVDYGGFRSQRRASQHSGMNDRDTKSQTRRWYEMTKITVIIASDEGDTQMLLEPTEAVAQMQQLDPDMWVFADGEMVPANQINEERLSTVSTLEALPGLIGGY
jgi:hypothetical protein